MDGSRRSPTTRWCPVHPHYVTLTSPTRTTPTMGPSHLCNEIWYLSSPVSWQIYLRLLFNFLSSESWFLKGEYLKLLLLVKFEWGRPKKQEKFDKGTLQKIDMVKVGTLSQLLRVPPLPTKVGTPKICITLLYVLSRSEHVIFSVWTLMWRLKVTPLLMSQLSPSLFYEGFPKWLCIPE